MNSRRILVALVPVLLLAAAAGAQTDPSARVTYIKEFPGSEPDYISISVQEDGQSAFRTAPDDKPEEFQISSGCAGKIFALTHQLNLFQGVPLESKKKVAQMGKKTLAFDDATVHSSTSFNHTENPDGVALFTLFEGLSRTEWARRRLGYSLRFDRLGIVKELLSLETEWDRDQLVEAKLLLPILQNIQSNASLVHVAQERAAVIITKITASADAKDGTKGSAEKP